MAYVMILQSFISIPIFLLHQNIPKPFLSRTKFEQLYIVKFLPLTPDFVGMLQPPNNETTPSGGFGRIGLHAWIYRNLILLISTVSQSYIVNFLQSSSNLVINPICNHHLPLLDFLASRLHLLSQIIIKHLCLFCKKPCLTPFCYSPSLQIFTTTY